MDQGLPSWCLEQDSSSCPVCAGCYVEGGRRGYPQPLPKKGEDRIIVQPVLFPPPVPLGHGRGLALPSSPARTGASVSGSKTFAPLRLACNLGTAPDPQPCTSEKGRCEEVTRPQDQDTLSFHHLLPLLGPSKVPIPGTEPGRDTGRRHSTGGT